MEADSESENSNPLDEIERQLINDLQDQRKEPATKGDLRSHAIRMDSRFGKIDTRFEKMDARLNKIGGRSDGFQSGLPASIRRDVWVSTAATMALNLAALGLVVSILK